MALSGFSHAGGSCRERTRVLALLREMPVDVLPSAWVTECRLQTKRDKFHSTVDTAGGVKSVNIAQRGDARE